MVRARQKKIVVTLVGVAAVVTIALAAHPIRDAVRFARLPATEKKVVGEWKTYTICGIVSTRFGADHTWTATGPDKDDGRPLRGHWRVVGNDIVSEVDDGQFEILSPPPPRQFPIAELSEGDAMVRALSDQNHK
jgi:hypothetical protein